MLIIWTASGACLYPRLYTGGLHSIAGREVSCYQGRYHRSCGKFRDVSGKVRSKKFLLGKNENLARQRAEKIVELWERVTLLWHRWHEEEQILRKHHGEPLESARQVAGAATRAFGSGSSRATQQCTDA